MIIAFSGIDGCGKTLQVEMLHDWLAENGYSATIVKAYDEQAKIACRPFIDSWEDEMAITFLFQALHAQQYALAQKAIAGGNIVIADRWDENYLAYHENFGRLSNDLELRQLLNRLAFNDRQPDVGILIIVPPETARKRRLLRGRSDRFENRSDEFYQKIQDSYESIARERGWLILDGTKTPQESHEKIIQIFLLRCEKK